MKFDQNNTSLAGRLALLFALLSCCYCGSAVAQFLPPYVLKGYAAAVNIHGGYEPGPQSWPKFSSLVFGGGAGSPASADFPGYLPGVLEVSQGNMNVPVLFNYVDGPVLKGKADEHVGTVTVGLQVWDPSTQKWLNVPGSSVTQSLYSSGAKLPAGVSPAYQASRGGSVSTVLWVPIDVSRQSSVFQFFVEYGLGPAAGRFDSWITVVTYPAGDHVDGYSICRWPGQPDVKVPQHSGWPCGQGELFTPFQYSPTFTVNVLPIQLIQLKLLPWTILYQPVGDLSTSTFQISNQFQTKYSVGTTTKNDNQYTTDSKWSSGFSLNLGFFSMTNSASWDTKVQHGTSTMKQDNAFTETQQTTAVTSPVPAKNPPPSLLPPGNLYPCSPQCRPQPFFYDTFQIYFHPQFAVYVYPDGPYVESLGQPGMLSLRGDELAACAGTNTTKGTPISIPSSIVTNADTIDPDECAAVLSLDPFYVAGSQNIVPPSAALLQNFLNIGDPGSSPPTFQSSTQTAQGTSNQTSITYSSSVESAYELTSSLGLKFDLGGSGSMNGGGVTGGGTVSSTHTTSVDVSYTSQIDSQYQQSITATVTLKDDGGVAFPVTVFRDLIFGSLMYSSPVSHPNMVTRPTISPNEVYPVNFSRFDAGAQKAIIAVPRTFRPAWLASGQIKLVPTTRSIVPVPLASNGTAPRPVKSSTPNEYRALRNSQADLPTVSRLQTIPPNTGATLTPIHAIEFR